MPLTREQLRMMKEDELRTEVLIPLFKAMEYRDVGLHHGGSGEQGKDIVMWESGRFGQRINYGVVAKRGKVSGKAEGKGSAANVTFQIQQSFGSPFRDEVTGEDQWINVCLVVATGVISKEARASIKNAIKGSNAERNVVFIDNSHLWSLLEEYLPESVVLEKLSEAKEVFERLSPHHRIVASVGEQIVLSTQPKYAGAELVDPIEIGFKLAYPSTPEGIAAREEFQRHVSTGSPITISSAFVQELRVPDFLKPFISTDKLHALAFGPRKSSRTVLTNIEIAPPDAAPITVNGVEFRAVQAGEDEITLDNSHQTTQWHFELRLSHKDHTANLTFDGHTAPQNVKRELEMLKVWDALSRGCKVSLILADSGMVAFEGNLTPHGSGPPAGLKDFLEQVLLIQTRTGVPITIPNRNISDEEVRSAYEFAAKLKTGTTTGTTNTVSMTTTRIGAENLLEIDVERIREGITINNLRTWRILDDNVPVGREVISLKGLTFLDADKNKLRALLAENPDSDSFTIKLSVEGAAAEVTVMYPDSVRGADPEHVRNLEALAHLFATREEIQNAPS